MPMHMGPGNMAPIRIDPHTLVRYWLVSPFTCAVLAALLLAAFWYFQATRDVAERGDHGPATRTLAFFAGLVAVELAFQSSLAMLPYISFPIQVVQKLLLLVVAPPLLVLGAPLALAVETSSPRSTGRLLGVVRSAPLRALTHPVVIFLLYFGGLACLLPLIGAGVVDASRLAVEPVQRGASWRWRSCSGGWPRRGTDAPAAAQPGGATDPRWRRHRRAAGPGRRPGQPDHARGADLHPGRHPRRGSRPPGRHPAGRGRPPWRDCIPAGTWGATCPTRTWSQSRPRCGRAACVTTAVRRRRWLRPAHRRGGDRWAGCSASPRRPRPMPSCWGPHRPAAPCSPPRPRRSS